MGRSSMTTTTTLVEREQSAAAHANRFVYGFSRHWLLIFNLFLGVYVGLPWLAPIFMEWGWSGAANVIYLIYSTQCHQLPQRSYFLFGPKAMYTLNEVQAVWQNTSNPLTLRQFIGNAEMGWKVAWSDRMVSMYTTLIPAGILFRLIRNRLKPLKWWGFALLTLPMIIDGGTHMLSDFQGIGQGFRDNNAWLAWLTGNFFPATFYVGDALGTFNSWMRIVTGVLFAVGCVWFAYPYLEESFNSIRYEVESKFRKAGISL